MGDKYLEFVGEKLVLKKPVKTSLKDIIFGKKDIKVDVYGEAGTI